MYKQSFNDKVSELENLPTFNPPTYSLIDANGEKIECKFYRPESQLVRSEKNESENRFIDEFTVHVISSASLEIFNTQFSGHYRQRGSGFGALNAAIGWVALPLARRFILPTAKRVGKELLRQSVPELLDVVSSNKITKSTQK